MHRIEKDLKELEVKHGISVCWEENDQEYTTAKLDQLKKKKEQLCASMWATMSKRQYLLQMKAKYAGKKKISLLLHIRLSFESRRVMS